MVTSNSQQMELVSTAKYQGLLTDDHLSFKAHIQHIAKKVKLLLGFYFLSKPWFSSRVKLKLFEASFLPIIDYDDVLYMNASSQCLHILDSVYHGALRVITNCGALTHHCTLHSKVNWPSLYVRRLKHWHVLIYKAILEMIPILFITAFKQK